MKRVLRSAMAVSAALVIAASACAQAKQATFLPEKDPAAPEGPAVKYLDAAANQHPRLLITADRIAQLKAFYNSPRGQDLPGADGRIYRRMHGAGGPQDESLPGDRSTACSRCRWWLCTMC